MNKLKCIQSAVRYKLTTRVLSSSSVRNNEKDVIVDFPHNPKITIPPYPEKPGESLEVQRARVIYQSRKRGTLENGILLSSFASRYVKSMDKKQLTDFDRLLNQPENEWDIYYWATGFKPTPPEFDHEVMALFKDHCRNDDRELRIRQPDLN